MKGTWSPLTFYFKSSWYDKVSLKKWVRFSYGLASFLQRSPRISLLSKSCKRFYLTYSFLKEVLQIITINLSQSLTPITKLRISWKQFSLLVSKTLIRDPLPDLKYVASLTKFLKSNVSLKSDKWFDQYYDLPQQVKFSYLFMILLSETEVFRKNSFLFSFGDR